MGDCNGLEWDEIYSAIEEEATRYKYLLCSVYRYGVAGMAEALECVGFWRVRHNFLWVTDTNNLWAPPVVKLVPPQDLVTGI